MSVEERYYKLNRVLLKLVGLWPYQDWKWTRVQALLIRGTYISAIFVQLAVLITHDFTVDIVLEVLSFVFPSIFMLFMYNMYYIKGNKIRDITEYMYYDWKIFKDKTEFSILDHYASLLKLFTDVFTFLLCIGLIGIIMSHVVPLTLDLISPLNTSRAQEVHALTEYFLDPSKYYYVAIIHMTIFVCLGGISTMGTGSSLLGYSLHVCAILKVANYRMKITIDKNVLQIPSPEMDRIIYKRIVSAVDAHRRAIQYIDLLMSSFETSFAFMIVLGVASLSINLYRLLRAVTAFNEVVEIFMTVVLVFSHFCYLFTCNHVGQQITNNNAEIFDTVYSLPWYTTSLNIQRLLIFLLQIGQKDIQMTVCGLFVASNEGFTKLATSSISYFTVIYAIQ